MTGIGDDSDEHRCGCQNSGLIINNLYKQKPVVGHTKLLFYSTKLPLVAKIEKAADDADNAD